MGGERTSVGLDSETWKGFKQAGEEGSSALDTDEEGAGTKGSERTVGVVDDLGGKLKAIQESGSDEAVESSLSSSLV
jgi:hypothetical protein